MAGRLQDVILRGLAAARPLPADVGPGTLYFATDTNVTTRNNDTMTAWESYSGSVAGTGDVLGPASSVDNHIPQFDGTTGKLLKDGLGLVTTVATPGVNTNVPSEKAVRDALIALPSGDVDGPASSVTDHIPQFADTTGKLLKDGLGVATVIATPGVNTQVATEKAVRDAITAIPASGGDVVGPASAISGNLAVFDGTTGKLIKDGGAVPSGGGGGTGGGGALVLLATQTASASTSLDFTTRNVTGQSGAIFQSDYDLYEIVLVNVVSAGSDLPRFQFSTDGGSSYVGGTNYDFSTMYSLNSGNGQYGTNSTDGIRLRPSNTSIAANGSYNGTFKFYNPLSATLYKIMAGAFNLLHASEGISNFVNTGVFRSTTPVNAFRFNQVSGGNITSGTIRVYGVAKTATSGGATVSTIAVVNQTGTFDAASLTTIASPAAVHTTGNAIAVLTRSGVAAQTVSGVTDTAGNAYTKVIEFPWYGGANTRLEFWLATNIVGHATNIVTATFSGSAGNRAINIVQLSGVETAGTIVASAGTTAVGGTVVATDIYNVRNAILLVGAQTDAIGSVWTPGTGFVSVGSDPSTVTYLEAAIVGNTSVDIIPTAGNSGGSQKAMIYMTLNAKNSASATSVSGSGGALVLLSTQTAAASASLDFATRNVTGQSGAIFQSDYDEYAIEILNLIPATGSTFSWMRMSTDGGATYDSTAIYNSNNFGWRAGASALGGGGASQAQIQLHLSTASGMSTTATGGLTGTARIYNPLSTTLHKQVTGRTSALDAGIWLATEFLGIYENTAAVNAFRILMSSGNITSGTIRVYGIAKTSTGSGGSSGAIVQVKNFQTGAYATGTGVIPLDNTIPQITEGTEFMTLAITPTSATNKLRIDIVGWFATGSASWIIHGLFQDSIVGAIAAFTEYQNIGTGAQAMSFTHYMTAGTTSPITFRFRSGRDTAGTTEFNGTSGMQLFGGVMASSITITEIVP